MALNPFSRPALKDSNGRGDGDERRFRQSQARPRHDRDATGAIAAADPAGIEAGIRTRTFPANSTSIAGTAEHAAPSRRV
jgi:hypothetical protein